MNLLFYLIVIVISLSLSLSLTLPTKKFKVIDSWIADCQDTEISTFLSSKCNDHFSSITSIKKAVRKGLIFINNEKANNDKNKAIKQGDTIVYAIPVHSPQIEKKNVIVYDEIQVIFEDDHFAVVLKPQGMTVFTTTSKKKDNNEDEDDNEDKDDDDDDDHTPSKFKYCLSTNVCYQLNMIPSDDSINMLRRPVPVHRLDRDTGGLVLVAKSNVALKTLSDMFSNRLIKKHYRAIVIGKLGDIGTKSMINKNVEGKEAITEYVTIAHNYTSCENVISTVDLYPSQGRKHQLRKHMKELGCPILNDPKYCTYENIQSTLDLRYKEMMLWAISLSLKHPVSGKDLHFTIPEPSVFQKVVEKLSTEMKKSYVYLLEADDESSYVGATKDLNKRLRQHNREIKGGAMLTSLKVHQGQQWKRLCYIEGFPSWTEALRFEWSWKWHTRSKKMLRDLTKNRKIESDVTTEKIKNPETQKMIKVGGPTYKKLVLSGKIKGFLPEMMIWRLSPLQRRCIALKQLMSTPCSTKKGMEFNKWISGGPTIVWESDTAKQIYESYDLPK